MQRNFVTILLFLLCASCNDRVKISGVVVDKSSNKPIDSVAVTGLDEVSSKGYDWVSAFTLPNGRFTLLYPSQEIKEKSRLPFIFQKDGYGSVTEFFPRDTRSDTIFLVKRF